MDVLPAFPLEAAMPHHKGQELLVPARVSSKGQVVIPLSIRRSLGLTSGKRILFCADPSGSEARIVPVPDDPWESSFGVLKGLEPGALKAVLRNHEEDPHR